MNHRWVPVGMGRALSVLVAAALVLAAAVGTTAAAASPAATLTGIADAVRSATALSAATAGVAPAADTPFRALVFSKTAGFRHDSIPAGIAAIQALGAANNFAVDATEDSAQFTDANLARYQVVIWLSTTADVLNATEQAAFERYIRAGGGYVGIHAAADTEYDWPWYGGLVGAYFLAHPANQNAVIKVEDKAHPSTAVLPSTWFRFDEWYNYRADPRGDVHVLASLDERSYGPGTGAMGHDHPTAWCHDYDGGRAWYTGSGHTIESFSEPQYLAHILGGIETAAGVLDADCSPTKDGSFEKVALDTNTNNPMEVDVAPDGRVFYIERDGRVQIIRPDTNTTVTALDLDVFTGSEEGLIGLRLDPNFATTHWVYLYWSPNDGVAHNLLSRFTVAGDSIDPATEERVLDVTMQRTTCCHMGGSMVFDSAGNLFLSTGDNTNPFESSGFNPIDERPGRENFDAQRTSANTNDLRGKILRITPQPDGAYTIPAGNLFPAGMAQTKPEIYAMGFRNPFRIGIDPETDRLYVADFGPDAQAENPNRGPEGTVEWNAAVTPGFYGWPYCDGNNYAFNDFTFPAGPSGPKFNCGAPVNTSPNNTGLTTLPAAIPATIDYDYGGNPLYPEIGGGGAPMAGPLYRFDEALVSDRKWPAYFDSKAVFGEWNQNNMYAFQVEADGRTLVDINRLLPDHTFIRPMDMEFGPDGALYLIEWGSGFGGNNDDSAVYRIDYTAGDRAPIAVAAGTPTSGPAPLTVQFSSEGSRDPDGLPVTLRWAFGDGGTSTEANPSHTYAANGNFTAQLTVSDGGRTATANVQITVGNTAPTVTLELPPDGGFYDWGDQVRFQVHVTDPEDGTIDCGRVRVQSFLGHDEHAHPLQELTGCTGIVQTSLASGHGADANVFAVIEATYTDDGGAGGANPLTGRDLVRLRPKRQQAEYFNTTGRAPDGTGGGDPGVVRETSGDSQGGFQNVGFIEDGDFFSFTPTNLTQIEAIRVRGASMSDGGVLQVRTGAVDGPLLGSATIAPTGGWQTYADFTTPITASSDPTPLFFVARKNPGSTNNGGLFNVNWLDLIGRGVTDNAPPRITVAATPLTGTAPLLVNFTAEAVDEEGDEEGDEPLVYSWEFGDGGTASTRDAAHTYPVSGVFTAVLTVRDARGAQASAAVTIRVGAPNSSCFGTRSDNFDTTTLDRARWSTIVRETQTYSVSGGKLLLPTAVGDLYATRNDATNLVLQDMPEGAWQATVQVSVPLTENYHQAGILVYGDDENYAKLDVLFSGGIRVEFIRETAGVPRNEGPDSSAAPTGDGIFLRVMSDGTNLSAAWSVDGQTFTPVGRPAALAGINPPKVGVFALNGGTAAPVGTAAFESFVMSPDGPGEEVDPNDEFAGTQLDKCRWDAIVREDPTAYRVNNGQLFIDSSNGDIFTTPNTAKNLILRNGPTGDWTMETKVDGSAFNEQYQQGGLIAYNDDDNYVKLDYLVDNPAGQPLQRRIELRGEKASLILNPQPDAVNLTQGVWFLRLQRVGDAYTGFYSADGVTWTTLGTVLNDAVGPAPKLGVFSLGAAQLASKTAAFDYIHVTAAAADAIAPTTTATVTGTEVNGWFTGPATVTLTATDNPGGSGVAGVQYAVDAGAFTPYTGPFEVTGDAVHSVRFRATDEAGNVEATKTVEVKIDTTAPVTTASFAPPSDGGWHNGTVPVILASTDAGSGVARIEYSLDGGPWTPYSRPVDVSGNGPHELLYKATDTAGNVETLKSALIKIDADDPTVLVSGLADGQLYGDSQDVRVSWEAVDPLSGIRSTVGSLDGRPYLNNTLQAMYELTLGLHTLTVTATDNAGNETLATVRFFTTTSFRDMQFLLDRFKATGRLSANAHKTLGNQLTVARKAEANGNDERAIRELRTFITMVTATLVPEAEVRAVLIRDAEAMILRLGGTVPATASARNGGHDLRGTGRLPGDVTRIRPGGRL